MHNISNLFYFGTTLYMFRTVFPSIIRSLGLYIQHHTIQVLWLLAGKQPQNLYELYLIMYLQSYTPDDKINLRYCASGWFYYRKIEKKNYCQTIQCVSFITALHPASAMDCPS